MLILDFDGTITDAETEGAPFRAGYLADVAALTDRSIDEIETMASEIEAEVRADPDNHGWVYNGNIVAPASVDPYLRVMPVARQIFDRCGVFKDEQDRNRLLDGVLYKYNYQKTKTAFREGAFEVLSTLLGTASWVVTNSHTDPVRNKIRSLDPEGGMLDWWMPRVHGRARKYVVDDDFDAVDTALELPGLRRPVLLRRRHYYDVISALLTEAGETAEQLWVVGDIFELDLSLPLAMGARVGLVVNEFTPAYEKAFVHEHPRGHIIEHLGQLPDLVGAS